VEIQLKALYIFYDSIFTDAERSYRSDCETDDGTSLANDNEFINGNSSQQLTRMKNRSPLGKRGQPSSPFPSEMTNRRMQNAHERLRNGKFFKTFYWLCLKFSFSHFNFYYDSYYFYLRDIKKI
jgi:hypothetical protein